jgi:hypothetical protein
MKATIVCGFLIFFANPSSPAESLFLYVWAGDADRRDSDFVAVIDAARGSPNYGDIRATVSVGFPSGAHHSEHRMPEDAQLFVNGFETGRSYVIDLREPTNPKVAHAFMEVDQFSYPHSFERLPNGNVIATFQNALGEPERTGGIVEMTPSGDFVRSASAAVSGMPEIRPYSLVPIPDHDLLVSSASDMEEVVVADSVQFWRLSNLELLDTLRLPPGTRGDEHEHPAEPRLMDDGETLLVNTFRCGLYRILDWDTENRRAEHIYTFEMADLNVVRSTCGLPATVGHYWIQTVPSRHGLVTLDVSQPEKPREVSYLDLGEGIYPHWMAKEPDGTRIVLTGDGELRHHVLMLDVDPSSGQLRIDRDFGNDGAVSFEGPAWSHGETGAAAPHGAVFSN